MIIYQFGDLVTTSSSSLMTFDKNKPQEIPVPPTTPTDPQPPIKDQKRTPPKIREPKSSHLNKQYC